MWWCMMAGSEPATSVERVWHSRHRTRRPALASHDSSLKTRSWISWNSFFSQTWQTQYLVCMCALVTHKSATLTLKIEVHRLSSFWWFFRCSDVLLLSIFYLNISSFTVHTTGRASVFTTRRYARAVHAMALCLTALRHKPMFYRNG